MLGIGRLGSQKTKPRWTAGELGQSLTDVMMGKDSRAIKKKAERLAMVCRDAGEGREVAAKFILEEMSTETALPLST